MSDATPKQHQQEILRHIDQLGQFIEDAEPDELAQLFRIHKEIELATGLLRSEISKAALGLGFDKDGQIPVEDNTGVIERRWQTGRTHWDWPLIASAYAGYMARHFDLPEDLAARIMEDLVDTIGGTKSKAWRMTELEQREIFSDSMRETSGGKWTVKYVPFVQDEEDDF